MAEGLLDAGTPAVPRLARCIDGVSGVIVISRNGQTTVITGWRAWLVGVAAFALLSVVFAVVAFVVLGLAITMTAVLFIVVPVAIGIAILASLFRSPERR